MTRRHTPPRLSPGHLSQQLVSALRSTLFGSTARRSAVRGASLLELIAVVTLLGIVVALVWSRYSGEQIKGVKKSSCEVQQGQIDTQVFLWYRQRGSWPVGDLSDIGGDTRFFQHGLPQCPVDGTPYELDTTTHRVKPHAH